ncbi:hypothetical protein Q75_07460 [Bacillus coahuilensis p1.1.43]|uniref:Uncharacterized protein n=1 Tax=Bacillus coahuilensis p1.1.43 TaxID=1150625 RepID=A0A147K869_9BACI|nr:hypothetical protein [Bacillus coahuilensis]KUP06374.1 hypothetical protein Q75_07460 [Bacillus coahuilensis p1.1.43]
MNSKELEQKIIENYQKDENMMILIFAQWCTNHSLNPTKLYQLAYPFQETHSLNQAISLTVPKEEAGHIATDTVINVLSLFGNDELAEIVSSYGHL